MTDVKKYYSANFNFTHTKRTKEVYFFTVCKSHRGTVIYFTDLTRFGVKSIVLTSVKINIIWEILLIYMLTKAKL